MTALDRPRVRVMTLNLNTDERALTERLASAADCVRAQDPDVLCVQESVHPDGGPTAAERLAARCGLPVVAQAEHGPGSRSGIRHGVAVLSRLPHDGTHTLTLADPEAYDRQAVAAELRTPAGRPLLVATAHLAWGGHREPRRLAEAVRLDAWCAALAGPESVTVLTGDFNATADTSTLRFLTGREGAGTVGTYWVDAWEAAGDGTAGATSTPANPWVAATARFVGITDPSLIPARRIDYVLVRGWAHGRPGCPLRAWLAADTAGPAGLLPSDHFAVLADLWDPPAG